MAVGQLDTLIRFIRRVAGGGPGDDQSDGQLLDRFIKYQDEAAFEALMNRYGGLVLSVCREILQDPHHAEDAFQATFLILVTKARSIRKFSALRSWLYGVAHRTAIRAKANLNKQRACERQGLDMEMAPSLESVEWAQLGAPLHEELVRLPDMYRLPILLCYYEKKTHEEAARELGCPLGTLKKRLTDGRELLRSRLVRHGLNLSAVGFAALLAEKAVAGTVPLALMKSTLRAALLIAAGKTIAGGVISTQVAALTEGVVHAMFVTKVKIVAAVISTAAVISVGGGAWTYHTLAAGRGGVDKQKAEIVPPKKGPKPGANADSIGGTWFVERSSVTQGMVGPESKEGPYEVVATKDQISFKYPSGSRDFTYRLDATSSPKQINLSPESEALKDKQARVGIYEWDGNTLRFGWDEGKPAERPKKFTAPESAQWRSFVLKRAVPTKAAGKDGFVFGGRSQGRYLLSCYVSAPFEISASQEKLIAKLIITNPSKQAIRLCTHCNAPELHTIVKKGETVRFEKRLGPHGYGSTKKELEILDKHNFILEPGKSIGLPFEIGREVYATAGALEVKSGYEMQIGFPNDDFWRGWVETNLVTVKIRQEGLPKDVDQLNEKVRDGPEKKLPLSEAGARFEEEAKNELTKLQGTWKVVSEQWLGKPSKNYKEIIFAGDQLTVGIAKLRFKLDPSKKPKHIDLEPIGSGYYRDGIYELDEDNLKLCLRITTKDGVGKNRPTDFVSQPEEKGGYLLLILKREPPAKANEEARLAPGTLAYAVKFSKDHKFAAHVLPGAAVDVVAGEKEPIETGIGVLNVKVLAIEKGVGGDLVVTFQVTPVQANFLALIRESNMPMTIKVREKEKPKR